MPLYPALLLLCQEDIRGQFGTVVGDNHPGIAVPLGKGVELAGDSFAGERVFDSGRQVFLPEVVDDAVIQKRRPTKFARAGVGRV
jgi:hypothetical protein